MARLDRPGSIDSGSRRLGRLPDRRRFVGLRPWLEGLESRLLLSTITWNTTAYPTGGNWDAPGSWTGGVVPGPSDTAKITGLTSPGTVYLDSGNADSVENLTTDSTTTLEVISGSLSLGVASSSTIGGPVIVEPNAFFNVASAASVTISAGQTFSDDGTLSFATADTVKLDGACCSTSQQIAVAGTLTASNTTFTTNSTGTSIIAINPGGSITAANSTFNLPIYLPYNDVPSLAGNVSFDQVEINSTTLPSGVLNLNSIGTNTSNLIYIFPDTFTVASGATVAVGPNVPVLIEPGLTFADDGTLSFAAGDTVTLDGSCCSTSQQIAVAGTLTANDTTFTTNGTGTSTIAVSSGGIITPTSSTFNLPLFVPYNDVQALSNNTSFDQIEINSTTLPSGVLNLNSIGTNTSNLIYVFPVAFTVASGATVAVGPNVPVLIEPGLTFTDDGTLSFSAGDTVTLDGSCCSTSQQIAVAGTLTSNDTTFTTNGTGTSTIAVSAGGIITPTSSTFNLPLFVPYNDVQALSNNTSFDQIEINSTTLPSGVLNLNSIGTNTSNLIYVFPVAFTIASGATVAVGPNVPVLIEPGLTFTDDGTLSFAAGDTVTLDGSCCSTSQQIAVAGTLTANDTTFTTNGTGTSTIAVSSGGIITPTSSTFNLPLFVPYNDVQALSNNTNFDQIEINSTTLPSGVLNLNSIGTNTSNLIYVFPVAFTVALGATVAVGTNVPVLIRARTDFHGRRHAELCRRRHRDAGWKLLLHLPADRRHRHPDRQRHHLHHQRHRYVDHRRQLRRHHHPHQQYVQPAPVRPLQRCAGPLEQHQLRPDRDQRRHPRERDTEFEPDRYQHIRAELRLSRGIHRCIGSDGGRGAQCSCLHSTRADIQRQRHGQLCRRRHRNAEWLVLLQLAGD